MNEKQKTRVVILGGGYAGTLAALRLAGKSKGRPVEIVLVNGHDHFVERIRHHQVATGQPRTVLPLPRILTGSGVHFQQGWCTAIEPAAKTLVVQTATGAQRMPYDYLIYALGSTVETVDMPGDQSHVYTLADQASVEALRTQLVTMAANRGQLLIVGGGLTGIEAATECAEQYPELQVTLVTKGKLGAALSSAGAAHLRRVFARLHIELIEGVAVEALGANVAHCSDGREIPFTGCLWAGTFVVPRLAAAAGLPVDAQQRLLVDQMLRVVDHPAIYAVGDAAATNLRMACATAMPMGAYAADHLVALINGMTAPQPFHFGYLLQCISLGRRDALVQLVDADDRAKKRIISGWIAAQIKELICRFTVWSLFWEKHWPGLYAWSTARPIMTQSPAATAIRQAPTEAPNQKRTPAHSQRVSTIEVPHGQTATNL